MVRKIIVNYGKDIDIDYVKYGEDTDYNYFICLDYYYMGSIQFIKIIDGQPIEGFKNQCSFDCYYYCYKMNFPTDIIWLT